MVITNELITGFLIAASAFITVAGVVLAVGTSRERLGKYASILLVVSLALGAALIVTALNWLGKPPDSVRLGWILLALQFITFYVPMSKLAGVLLRK